MFPDSWRDLIVAADPGFANFRRGARAFLASAIAALLLTETAKALGLPATDALVGVLVAMLSAVAVNDPSPKAQKITMLLVPVVASASVTAGAAATGHSPILGDIVFLLIIFASIAMRPLGPRYFGLGFVAFLTYYYSLFFHPQLAAMPWTAASIFVSVAIACAVRFGLIRDRPDKAFSQMLNAFRARLRLTLAQLAHIARGAALANWRWRRMGAHVAKLNESALALHHPAEENPSHEIDEWSNAILRVEMAAETLVDGLRPREDAPLRSRELARVFERPRAAVRGAFDPLPARAVRGDVRAGIGSSRLRASALELLDNIGAVNQTPSPEPDASKTPAPGGQAGGGGVRRAVQATIATGIAIAAGHAISGQRWYWAIIAAFVVYNRAQTTEETLGRALHRIGGTALGVCIGIALADAAVNHQILELFLVFLCVFGAYYFLRLSYAWTVVFFTTALALLYGLLGRYSPGLLVLRLEETLIGAAAGVLASFVIFPSRTTEQVHEKMARVLRQVADLLDKIAGGDDFADEHARTTAIRSLDSAFQDLYNAAAPITASIVGAGASDFRKRARHVFTMIFCIRQLLRFPREAAGEASEAAKIIAAGIRGVADALECKPAAAVRSPEPLIRELFRQEDHSAAGEWLDRMSRALSSLARLHRIPLRQS